MIKTERLILRPPRSEDCDAVHAAMNAVWPDLQDWMSWAADGANTRDAVAAYIAQTHEMIKRGDLPLFGFCRARGDFVMVSGLGRVDGGDHEFRTGYWVAKPYLGHGYATEAAIAAIRYAFDVFRAKRVRITYYEGNDKSANIINKLGFTFLETVPKSHTRFSDGAVVDKHRYVMDDPSSLPPINVTWDDAPPASSFC